MGRDIELPGTRRLDNDSAEISLEVDEKLRGDRSSTESWGHWKPSASSHCLLAACGADQRAQETWDRSSPIMGRFTASLLNALRNMSKNLNNITYSDLLNSLDDDVLCGQHPHCGHMNQDWLVFTNTSSKNSWLLQCNPSEVQTYKVNVGWVGGTCETTEFGLVTGDASIRLIIHELNSDHSILRLKQGSHQLDGYRARVTCWKDSAQILTVSGDDALSQLVFDGQRKFIVIPEDDKPDIIFRKSSDEFILEWQTGLMKTWLDFQVLQTPKFKYTNQDHLCNILDGLAHFKYVLNYHGGSMENSDDDIQLELYQLKGNYGARTIARKMVQDNTIVFTTGDKSENYAIGVSNNTTHDLFPYVFYLTPETCEITATYLAPRSEFPSLLSNKTLLIGAGTEKAFQFTDSGSSFGVMKLFIFTKYHHLDWITQRSVFDANFKAKGKARNFGREEREFWKAIQVTLHVPQ
ncbi:hypothetical protein C8R44DRAFT_350215 [Mycena epipterygia]|nr:hypothetical protein C8R44DRAFT_350215 [Mycena epipterygia]